MEPTISQTSTTTTAVMISSLNSLWSQDPTPSVKSTCFRLWTSMRRTWLWPNSHLRWACTTWSSAPSARFRGRRKCNGRHFLSKGWLGRRSIDRSAYSKPLGEGFGIDKCQLHLTHCTKTEGDKTKKDESNTGFFTWRFTGFCVIFDGPCQFQQFRLTLRLLSLERHMLQVKY